MSRCWRRPPEWRGCIQITRVALGILMLAGLVPAQDPRSIVARAVAADDHSDRLARDYTYKIKDAITEHDASGGIKVTHSTLDEVLYIAGKRYFHPLEKDGKPLPPDQQRKEEAKLDRAVHDASRLTEAQKEKRLHDAESERARRREDFKEIPDAFDFRMLGDAVVSEREVWRIGAKPRAGYQGKMHAVLSSIEGTLWIDKADFNWVKFEAEVLKPFRIAWFLARVNEGTHISYQMRRINDELWVPENVTLNASARLLLLKKVNVEQRLTFSDYRKFQSDSRIVESDPVP